MNLKTDDYKYLSGELFSNGRLFDQGSSRGELIYRLSFLENISKGKNLVHVGFADHIPLIKGKIKNKKWLHQLLIESANECIGIDIDANAVDYIRNEIGIKEVYKHDLIVDKPIDEITNRVWDYLIIGEVLEHIDNPVYFLSTIKEKYKDYFKQIIITVPNAFDLVNLKYIFKNKEFINTDHRYTFTPFTISKVCHRAGYQIDDILLSQSFAPSNKLIEFLLKKYPLLREGLIIIITPK